MINTPNQLQAPKRLPENVVRFSQKPAPESAPASLFPANTVPMFGASASPLGFQQAQAIKFSAYVRYAPHMKKQMELMQELKSLDNQNDPKGIRRASVAELLGNAHVTVALEELFEMTQPDVPVQARISAFKALASIATVSDYAATQIDEVAREAYLDRSGVLMDRVNELEKQRMEDLGAMAEGDTEADLEQYLIKLEQSKEELTALYEELDAITRVMGQTNIDDGRNNLARRGDTNVSGKTLLKVEMDKRFAVIEGSLLPTIHAFETALNSASDRFFGSFVDRIEDYPQVLEDLTSESIKSIFKSEEVTLPNGNQFTVEMALAIYTNLLMQLEVHQRILGSAMKGLASTGGDKDLPKLRTAFDQATTSGVAADAMRVLSSRKMLLYPDIEAKLTTSPARNIRQAAFVALQYAPDEASKKKLLELTNIYKYFSTVGYPTSDEEFSEQLYDYNKMLLGIVTRGDEFIDLIADSVTGRDADPLARRMGLLLLGTMFEEPFKRELEDGTLSKAFQTLQHMSSDPYDPRSSFSPTARFSTEKDALRLLATQYALKTKSYSAIQSAMNLMLHPAYARSARQREVLLRSMYNSLLAEYEEVRKDVPGSPNMLAGMIPTPKFQQQVLDVVFDNATPEYAEKHAKIQEFVQNYESKLSPDSVERNLAVQTEDNFEPMSTHKRQEVLDTGFISFLKEKALDNYLHPLLGDLMQDPNEEGSVTSRALAARILGVLEDQRSVDDLIQLMSKPLKLNEHSERQKSHADATLAGDAKVLRASAATALGYIGDPKAVGPMVKLLGDPVIGPHIVNGPLAMLAPEINVEARDLTKLQQALMDIPADELEGMLEGWMNEEPVLKELLYKQVDLKAAEEALKLATDEAENKGEEPPAPENVEFEPEYTPENLRAALFALLSNPATAPALLRMPLGRLGYDPAKDTAELKQVRETLMFRMVGEPNNSGWHRHVRINAAKTLAQFDGGIEMLKQFAAETKEPNFKRHVLSALVSSDYALAPSHPDHELVKPLLEPELGVTKLHEKGYTGKGVEMAIVDVGFVNRQNTEGFQDRVKLPPHGHGPTVHTHPTMVATTAAGNGVLKGVAPDATIYTDNVNHLYGYQQLDGLAPFRRIIEGKLRGENNIRVINNSYGWSTEVINYQWARGFLQEFKKLVEMAELVDVQLVFAAGNDGQSPYIPGIGTLSVYGLDMEKMTGEDKAAVDYILDKVIVVGATNTQGSEDPKDHRLADFSSRGDAINPKLTPTVVAPGADMMVYGYENGRSSKEFVNGTSFASPYVAGLLALMIQANPKLKNADLRKILRETAVELPYYDKVEQGAGEVNPYEAVKAAKTYGKKKKADDKAEKPEAKKPAELVAKRTKGGAKVYDKAEADH